MPHRPCPAAALLMLIAAPLLLSACADMSGPEWPRLLPTEVILATPQTGAAQPGQSPDAIAAEEARRLAARAAALQARATKLRNQ